MGDAGMGDAGPSLETIASVDTDAFPWLAVDPMLSSAGIGAEDEH